jgi:polyhydroxyalkanoate synthesis regulator phasin
MIWKKCMFLFIIFWSMLLISSSHLYAGEAELINLLKKKGIITQQEAEQLLQEVRSEAQKEKEDAKKSITTEIKADIKKMPIKASSCRRP